MLKQTNISLIDYYLLISREMVENLFTQHKKHHYTLTHSILPEFNENKQTNKQQHPANQIAP